MAEPRDLGQEFWNLDPETLLRSKAPRHSGLHQRDEEDCAQDGGVKAPSSTPCRSKPTSSHSAGTTMAIGDSAEEMVHSVAEPDSAVTALQLPAQQHQQAAYARVSKAPGAGRDSS